MLTSEGRHLISRAVRERVADPVFRHSLAYGAGRLVPAACTLGSIAMLSRVLGKEGFGGYALASSLALFWANVGSVWLAQGVLRFHTRFENSRLATSYATFSRQVRWLCVAIAATGAGTVSMLAHAPLSLTSGCAALAGVEATVILAVATEQARMQPRLVIFLEGARAVLGLLGMALVAIFLSPPTAAEVVWATSVGGLVALLGRPISRPEAGKMPYRSGVRRVVASAMLRYGIPIAAFSLLSYALNVADRFLIARWKGLGEAGTYAAVYDTTYRSFGFLLFPVLLGAHPLITKAWNARDRGAARRALRVALSIEIAVGVPLVVGLAVANRLVVRYALGTSLDGSFELVLTVGLAALLWQLAQLVHKPSELSGRLGVLVTGILLALVINVVANSILLPRATIVIAGYTSALASASYLIFVLWRQGSEVTR